MHDSGGPRLGPYIQFDGLPPLYRPETALPLAHPYGPVRAGRFVTPGGGRLGIHIGRAHHRVTLDHFGCPAQTTEPKTKAFKQLALAAEGHCVQAGCTHSARWTPGERRPFEVIRDGVELTAFVRALLAIEVGDFAPATRLFDSAVAAVGSPPRRSKRPTP
ncbi:DUF6420 family protein [Streptomyces spectabilis]|nr:DUF6420 family protein [Streptomyces spectabilis]